MRGQGDQAPALADESLVLLSRAGDRAAFAELWERHARSGLRVARQFTSTLDADDLVSEAYTRIYQAILDGGGPQTGFRPYLYTTIRNRASRWGGSNRDVHVDDIDAFEDERLPDDPSAVALDRSLTVRAFRSLPDRWQAVLWYTEVEGMDPHEVAPILGISANGVAALSYRAREGLRSAWLQAHISDDGATAECRWTIQRLGENARHSLTDREQTRIDAHLRGCAKCCIISEEVDEVGSRLAFVMLPLLLGATVGGTLLASASAPAAATAAQLAASALPPAFDVLAAAGATAPAISGGIGATSALATPMLAGTFALAIAVGGGVATSLQPLAPSDAAPASLSQSLDSSAHSQPAPDEGVASALVPPVSPTDIPAAIVDAPGQGAGEADADAPAPSKEGASPGGGVGADISLTLEGTATPGANISLQAAGLVYATTTVDDQRRFVLTSIAIPGGIAQLDLVQTVDPDYLLSRLGSGAQNGPVDKLIKAHTRPVVLKSGGDPSIAIRLLD